MLVMFLAGSWHLGNGTWIFLKAHLAQYLLERAWAKTLTSRDQVKPWPWADTWPIARLLAPQHDIDMFILAHASGRTLAFGPGHVSSSPLPGERGTTILNGHRDTHFQFLEHINRGDTLVIEQPNRDRISFTVFDKKVVNVNHAVIYDHPLHSHLVLITCYPFDAIEPGSPLRYVLSTRAESHLPLSHVR